MAMRIKPTIQCRRKYSLASLGMEAL